MKSVVCIANVGFEASLETRKLYNVEDDQQAEALGMIRVIDESDESHLYPHGFFALVAIHNVFERHLLDA